jgi:taurine dioxygenase
MSFEVAPLPGQDEFGAVVTGLSPDSLSDPRVRKALYDLWIDKGVVVFRDMDGIDTQLRLSEVFGEPEEHPLLRGVDVPREHKLIIDFEYNARTGEGEVYEVDGEVRGGWLPWHSDLVYVSEINHGGILRPVVLPERGGETGYIDQIAVYESLPAELKQQIEGLNVLYKFHVNSAETKFGQRPDRMVRMSDKALAATSHASVRARSIHPMVYTQEQTGRKVLNVSPWFADAIEGMETEDGDRLLGEVIDYCIRPERAYFHQWKMGDMVLWDNWRMLHHARGTPEGMHRHMSRTTIAGDYGLGRYEQTGDATEEKRVGL